VTGTLALVGGGELTIATEEADADLLTVAATGEVLVVPAAAAFEHPQRAVDNATAYFARLGAKAVGCRVLARPDALDEANARQVREAAFIYVLGGSPMHLRSVLKATPVWDALVAAHQAGAVLAASSAGAMVLTDPMVDPRGGAFTIGLGLVRPLSVVPHVDEWSHERLHRTLQLAGADVPVLTLATGATAVCSREGAWRSYGEVKLWRGGVEEDLGALTLSSR
jgi:cyanophycinase